MPPSEYNFILATIDSAPDAKQVADKTIALANIEAIAERALVLRAVPLRGEPRLPFHCPSITFHCPTIALPSGVPLRGERLPLLAILPPSPTFSHLLSQVPLRSEASGCGKKLHNIRQGRLGPSLRADALAIVRRVLGAEPRCAAVQAHIEASIEQASSPRDPF